MTETEHVLINVDDHGPCEIADVVGALVGVAFRLEGDELLAHLDRGGWLSIDRSGWVPMDGRQESGGGFRWDVAVNGGGGDSSPTIAVRVYDLLALHTRWDVGLYIDSELQRHRPAVAAA